MLSSAAFWLAVVIPVAGQQVIYVDQNATGPVHDGTTWCTAYLQVSEALPLAQAGDTVRVADGVYKPDPTGLADPREATFTLTDGVRLEGGYAGCGAADPNERDFEVFESVLSGDLDGNDGPNFFNRVNNSYTVVSILNLATRPILDGFTITGGNNNRASFCGGGICIDHADPLVTNSRIKDNESMFYGGGVSTNHSNCQIIDSHIERNRSGIEGGAMYFRFSTPTVERCVVAENNSKVGAGISLFFGDLLLRASVIRKNTSVGNGSGAGVSIDFSFADIQDCVVSDNQARGGAGLIALDSALTLTNCTIFRNVETGGLRGAGLDVDETPSIIRNCIFWQNSASGLTHQTAQIDRGSISPDDTQIHYSCVQGWNGFFGGVGNFGDDPLFLAPNGADGLPGTPDDDLRLSAASSSINKGDPFLPRETHVDLEGYLRVQGCRTDLGAYETATQQALGDFDGDGDRDLNDIAGFQICLQPSAFPACICAFDFDGDGALDLTDFSTLLPISGP